MRSLGCPPNELRLHYVAPNSVQLARFFKLKLPRRFQSLMMATTMIYNLRDAQMSIFYISISMVQIWYRRTQNISFKPVKIIMTKSLVPWWRLLYQVPNPTLDLFLEPNQVHYTPGGNKISILVRGRNPINKIST